MQSYCNLTHEDVAGQSAGSCDLNVIRVHEPLPLPRDARFAQRSLVLRVLHELAHYSHVWKAVADEDSACDTGQAVHNSVLNTGSMQRNARFQNNAIRIPALNVN